MPPGPVVWCLFGLTLALLMAPAVTFLLHGWWIRNRDILGTFTEEASKSYLRTFHPSYFEEADRGRGSISSTPGEFKVSLEKYYTDLFGRRLFVFPLLLCSVTAATLLALCATTTIQWIATERLDNGTLPLEVVMAILGGYMWVVSDQMDISLRDNLLPASLYGSCFRLVIAVPIAYAFSKLFPAQAAIPMSFLLGTFPTKTIVAASRTLIGTRWAKMEAADLNRENPITKLRAVDTRAADRFAAEDISTIFQLANSDPVRLAIRTGLSYGYILDCCGKALLWNYVGDRIDVFEERGMIGVYEVRKLWLQCSSTDPDVRGRALTILGAIAERLHLNSDEAWNLLTEVAENPNTIFQHDSWMPFFAKGHLIVGGIEGKPTTAPLAQSQIAQ